MRTMMWKRTILTALAAGSLLVSLAGAQEGTWTYRVPPSGWVGISVDYFWGFAEGEEKTLVVIKNVVEGSPAEEQGLRVGDTIASIDGRPVSQQTFLRLRETLKPGDLVRMVVLREGEEQEFLIEAGTGPAGASMPRPDIDQLVIAIDTVRGAIVKDLESLSLSISGLHLEETQGEVSIRLLQMPDRGGEFLPRGTLFRFPNAVFDTLSVGGEAFVLDPDFAMPFQAFFVQSETTDTIRSTLTRLREELTGVQRQARSRQQQIVASIQGPPEEYLRRDEILQELRAREAELVTRQEELSKQLSEVIEQESRRQWAEAEVRSREAFEQAQWDRVRTREVEEMAVSQRERAARDRERLYEYQVQYRTPQIWGQNYVLGAELLPLNPENAEIYEVDHGVVVWAVPEGTPAADFGLRSSDVIVEVAGEEVRSIHDLRLNLEVVGRPITIRVVRRGQPEPVEIVIRR
jgi:membrane-associated protease RseP (regulator of RpoE activity)